MCGRREEVMDAPEQNESPVKLVHKYSRPGRRAKKVKENQRPKTNFTLPFAIHRQSL